MLLVAAAQTSVFDPQITEGSLAIAGVHWWIAGVVQLQQSKLNIT
jgi:hypothetical protein